MNTIEVLRSRSGYLGVVEAAELLNMSRDTLCDWINAGKFKAYRVGNANKIDRLYLADWLEEREMAKV
jgi:excisionase family DNA binding protein